MKLKLLLFVVGLVTLLVFQAKVVMPYVYDIAASDLFLENSGDEVNRASSATPMTKAAFNQCNTFIAADFFSNDTVSFSENPLNAFSLGNFRYIINADIDIQPSDGTSFTKRYVCRIQYSDGTDMSGVSDSDSWSIDGISGLDNS